MNFDSLFKRYAVQVTVSLLSAIFSGILYAAMIPLILFSLNSVLSEGFRQRFILEPEIFKSLSTADQLVLFICACSLIILSRSFSQITLVRMALEVTSGLQKSLFKKISDLPVYEIEKKGFTHLFGLLTIDIGNVVAGSRLMPELIISTITIFGLFGFLIYINPKIFVFIILSIVFGIVTYQIPMKISSNILQKSGKRNDRLYNSIKGLILGIKELKLNLHKKNKFVSEELMEVNERILEEEKKAYSIMLLAISYGDLIAFLVIGVITFYLSKFTGTDSRELVGIVMVMLYITGPILVILKSIPDIAKARISLENIKQNLPHFKAEPSNPQLKAVGDWNHIIINNLEYQYEGKDPKETFQVGPIDLELKKGKIYFIVGGNGSGKSTLGKLLTLHYFPQSGAIYFDRVKIDADNIVSYRQLISAIYTDYFLFDKIYDTNIAEKQQLLQKYLSDLQLETKVSINDGHFSTKNLSDGQRKRMALLSSLVEDRQIYVFDEWAADQDPIFKKIFYKTILFNLKRDGKTIIIISHDDRYFHLADEVIRMEDGQIEIDQSRYEKKIYP